LTFIPPSSFSENEIGDEGATAIGVALEDNQTLITLE
jgi:hypothetical protein